MPIQQIYAFLVHPNKGSIGFSDPSGVSVPLSGELFDHLEEVYRRSTTQCKVDVALIPDDPVNQHSEIRELLIAFAVSGQIDDAVKISRNLSSETTKRSGLGLLFLIRSVDSNEKIDILLSRFPTNTAILVDDVTGMIDVKFLDNVYVKTHFMYKAALFSGIIAKGEFWQAKVQDKQISGGPDSASQYWVKGFLKADFTTTSHHGSTRFARALKDASVGLNFDQKKELHRIAGAAELLDGLNLSPEDILDRFNASVAVRDQIFSKLKRAASKEIFVFSPEAYNSVISFRTVETAEGSVLSASSSDFEKIFNYETIRRDERGEIVRLTTEGLLASDKLKRGK